MKEIFGLFLILLSITFIMDAIDERKNKEYLQSLDDEMDEWQKRK